MDFWNIDFDFLALLKDWRFVLPEDLLETARNFARLAVSTCAASTVLKSASVGVSSTAEQPEPTQVPEA